MSGREEILESVYALLEKIVYEISSLSELLFALDDLRVKLESNLMDEETAQEMYLKIYLAYTRAVGLPAN